MYRIDAEAADAEWRANTDEGRGGSRKRCESEGFRHARLERVRAEADLLRFKLLQRRAELVDAAALGAERQRVAEIVTAAFLSLPNDLAPGVATVSDEFQVRAIIEAALRARLHRVAAEIDPATA